MQIANPACKPTAPIKLRAACNQCHMSKVRCSGERTGCSRCLGLGFSCVYSESRVGKVQGNRARRRHTEPGRDTQAALPTPDASSGSVLAATPDARGSPSTSGATSTATTTPMDTHQMQDGDDIIYGDYLQDTGIGDCSLLVGFDEFQGADTSLGPLIPTDSLGSDLDHFGLPAHASGNVIPESSPLPLDKHLDPALARGGWDMAPEGKHARHPFKHPTSQHMLDCVGQVYNLEQHIHGRLVAPDEVMRVNKQCIVNIITLLEYEETSPSMSLLGICCLLLNHVVTLFDAGLSNLFGKEKRNDYPNSRMPAIQFGNFRVDPEEHLAIQGQIFLREVQRSQRATEKLIARLQLVHDDRGNLASIYSHWVKDMQRRLQALCETIDK